METFDIVIIGAGPGAPDLISLRGYRCLQRADVVIFDHLVNPELLDVAPAHAERIDVGAAARTEAVGVRFVVIVHGPSYNLQSCRFSKSRAWGIPCSASVPSGSACRTRR